AWVLRPLLGVATRGVGARITRHTIPPGFKASVAALFDLSIYQREFWHQLVTLLKPWFWPYAVGSTIGALLLAALAYPLALAFVNSRKRIHDMMHHTRKPGR